MKDRIRGPLSHYTFLRARQWRWWWQCRIRNLSRSKSGCTTRKHALAAGQVITRSLNQWIVANCLNLLALPNRCFSENSVQKLWKSRATILRHVGANDSFCDPRMLDWIDNFECLILAFSCDLDFFFIAFDDTRRCEGYPVIVGDILMLATKVWPISQWLFVLFLSWSWFCQKRIACIFSNMLELRYSALWLYCLVLDD
jgi:hypothetical protein